MAAAAEVAEEKEDPNFHVIHKVPAGDGPYVRAKHLQLVDKDPEASIVWFWKAINTGDRVDSALKDMAVVMKQQDRAEDAVEAVKSFRHLCSKQAQESLDNVLIDLYKKCGRIDEQIEMLKHKLRMITTGEAFNGKTTKTARSHGKKFQVSIKQETTRILGNLGWAYMQQANYELAEVVYRKAQEMEPDANKACNLALCLMKQRRYDEARDVLEDVRRGGSLPGSDEPKTSKRAGDLLREMESQSPSSTPAAPSGIAPEQDVEDMVGRLDYLLLMRNWAPLRARRLPIFEEISTYRDQLVDKDPEASIVWFWKAINTGDRVDSALKDMAVVMKQQDRAEDAVEAVKSFRHLCSKQAQESLDNVLIDLYKKCGRIDEQIEMLKHKLRMITTGEAFNGKTTKTARSHGKKFQVSIKQETTRILGNLGWAYMQQANYVLAEVVYRKALEMEPDANKACNLALCLMKQRRYGEARDVLEDVRRGGSVLPGSDEPKTSKRAGDLLREMELQSPSTPAAPSGIAPEQDVEDLVGRLDYLLLMRNWAPLRARRLPIFEEISTYRDQVAC